ncbi:HEAT repeat domain-containing protein [Alienimonas chondri]|uniref:HEAT repeat domain-containing protein n=1 Tax=Alienimonas chondri TaxID=2681879 RepID=UPI001489AC45|nr:HEAT repeat domain-containing protein [Alienimonas chondri]
MTAARLLAALASSALLFAPGNAVGQDDLFDDPFEEPAPPSAVAPSPFPPGSAEKVDQPDPMTARLEAARVVLTAEGVADPLPQPGPLLVAFERASLPGARNNTGTVRTLSGVVRALNTGLVPVHLGPGTTLTANGQVLLPNVLPDDLRGYSSNDIRGEAADWESYRTVDPGSVAEFPAAFVNLPGSPNHLPASLTLTVPYVVGGTLDPPNEDGVSDDEVEGGEAKTVTLDVAAYHRGLADLAIERTGPQQALAVVRVRGELTYLGRFAALSALRSLADDGVRRGVLLWENVVRDDATGEGEDGENEAAEGEGAWQPTVPALSEAPVDALGRSGFDPARQSRFSEFGSSRSTGSPPMQAGFTEFARAPGLLDPQDREADDGPAPAGASFVDLNSRRAALLAGGMANGSQGPAADFGNFHDDATSAVSEVLESALRTLDAEDAEALIRSAEPLVLPAALRHAGPNLAESRVPLLIEYTQSSSAPVRSAAAAALGAFDREDARSALAALVTNAEDPKLAADAAESLAVSRFPKAQTALAATLTDGAPGVPAEVFGVLADHSDPAWEDLLVKLAGDASGDPAVRVAALRAVVAGRSSAADRLLAEAIAGEDEVAARAAFEALGQRSDPASRAMAERYALAALRTAAEEGRTLDGRITEYLLQNRPPGAAEPLWTLFENAPDDSRAETIKLLAAIAPAAGEPGSAETVGGRLADAWEPADRQARMAILSAVADLAPDRLPELAGEALKSGDQMFEATASAALETAGVDPDVWDQLVIDAFQASEQADAAGRLATALIARATPATRGAVLEGRWDENPVRRAAADAAMSELTQYGPGKAFFIRGMLTAAADSDGDDLPDGGAEPHRASLRYLDIAVRLDPTLAAGWSQRAFSRGQAGELEGARDDYRRALELDPYDNLAMTGLAILEIELGGDVDAGLARGEAGLKKYPDDALFAYNMACVYGVAAKSLADKKDAESVERFETYRDKAREHLVRSYRLGLDGDRHRHHASTDPDLDTLHGDPVFEKIIAGTLPPAQDADEDDSEVVPE